MSAVGDVVLRVRRDERYKVISAVAVEDNRLSLKAKGLHTYLITRPDGWKFSYRGLLAVMKDGIRAIQAASKELKAAGYLEISAVRQSGRFVGWTWTVSETSQTIPP